MQMVTRFMNNCRKQQVLFNKGDRNLSQFLTTFGLDLLSRPPQGGFFYSSTGCTTTDTNIV